MGDFDGLDLQAVEDQLDDETDDDSDGANCVVLGVLDGSTAPEEWVSVVAEGNILVLNVEGDLNQLASGFARDVKDGGGSLTHFRGFLVVTPAGVDIDTDRLSQ
ncbi:hypothetical protein SAMN05216226_10643 [Halovenus aranensis]|jgi:hypothetical protein|uniref:Cell division protein SepF n=1 Tax=Halovenus aranensis TaxID=890420 RepID=A0A1G8V7L6_9EURY|nr:DUF5779 family protein [Halovenus aranensis]SDJ62003.1 hypothetical protein SAMN05216226_10643 [Halovenus aranensis]